MWVREMMLSAAVLALLAVPAGADPLESDREFHVIDRDDNGAIELDEAERNTVYPLLAFVFDAVDLDGSGAIEYREWDRARFYVRGLDAGGPGAAGF
ncbi:hypothetical protein H0Z60_11260 [Ectothiorhodospiraceae bacterium WFHF3C12]|nr:hypothetical protein [Ectothiorhodospiraceae bacterium WFHF3C12]